MGAYQNNGHDGAKKGSKRGSVRNDNRLEAFASGSRKGSAEWTGCSSERLQGVIEQITSLGGAITFGLSRDGGAHMLTLLLDDNKKTLWFNGDADLDDELDAVAATLAAMV